MLDNLTKAVGLHESIEVIYVVDGYKAFFVARDGAETVCEAHDTDVFEALVKLDRLLEADGDSVPQPPSDDSR